MDENQGTRAEEELRILDNRKADLEKILRKRDGPASAEQPEDSQGVDLFDLVEQELDVVEQRRKHILTRINFEQDLRVATGLRRKGQEMADQAKASWEPRLQRLTWTLTGIGGAVLSTSYAFLRSDPSAIYLKAAMIAAALALAFHLLVQLLHVLIDDAVIQRANMVAMAHEFDDPTQIYEWLDSTTQTMMRWHLRLPTVGLMVQMVCVMTSFALMLVGIMRV